MKYIKAFLFLVSFTMAFIFFSCENATTPATPTKSVRDYTWTIDTLNIPDAFQNLMRSMYAANSEDIYLVGHNSGSQIYLGDGAMWHYNGKDWSVVRLREEVGAYGTLKAVHGSSSNNIWAVGGSFEYATILQFNGATWKKHLGKSPNGIYDEPLSKSDVYSVYAESETEVWACGDGGLIYHYDGTSWDVDTFKVELKNNDYFQLVSIVKNNNKPYALGTKVINNGIELEHYFLSKVDGKWVTIVSFTRNRQDLSSKWGTYKLYSSTFGKLYSYGVGGVFEWNGTNWIETLAVSASIDGLFDSSENNILAVGANSVAFHFNGSVWEELILPIVPTEYLCGTWVDSNEAIIVGQLLGAYPMKTIVLHGK